MEICEMRAEHVTAAAGIEACNFSMPWKEKDFLEAVSKQETLYLVAIQEGKVLGYCGFWQGADEADITNVAVDAGARKRGIGKTLIRELVARGVKRGVKAFYLEVRESNMAAIALYESAGFEKKGVRKNFYQKPTEHAIVMAKIPTIYSECDTV